MRRSRVHHLPELVMASIALTAATVVIAPGARGASLPTTTGCPASHELASVSAVEAQGYSPSPRLVDEAGNHNGLVCRLPLPEVFLRLLCDNDCPVPLIYSWKDDSVPLR